MQHTTLLTNYTALLIFDFFLLFSALPLLIILITMLLKLCPLLVLSFDEATCEFFLREDNYFACAFACNRSLVQVKENCTALHVQLQDASHPVCSNKKALHFATGKKF